MSWSITPRLPFNKVPVQILGRHGLCYEEIIALGSIATRTIHFFIALELFFYSL